MSFFSPKIPKPQATPVTPRLSDAEIQTKAETGKTRRRRGIEDQILSLGRRGSNDQNRTASLLGRTAA